MRAAHTHRSVTALRGRSSRRGVCMRGAAAMPSCNGSAQSASGKRVVRGSLAWRAPPGRPAALTPACVTGGDWRGRVRAGRAA